MIRCGIGSNTTTAMDFRNSTRRLLTTIPPNVVFVGDSITERWQGTKYGKVATADMEARLVGRQVTVTLSPLPKNKRLLKFNHPDHEYDDQDDVEDADEIDDA